MKKQVMAVLAAGMIFMTGACSGADTGVDKPVQGTSAGVKATSASKAGGQVKTNPTDAVMEESTEPKEEPRQEAAIEELVLMDEKDVTIIATGFEETWLGPAVKVLIENHSNLDLTIQTGLTSVNGYMIDTIFSSDVAAGKKANDEITLSSSGLDSAGIHEIADIETSFRIITMKDFETYHESDTVTITTNLAKDYEYSFDDSGQLLYNDKDIRIIAKGISSDDSFFGPGLVMFIENLRDESIVVQARDVSINGFMVSTIFSTELAPGKRAVDAVTFLSSELEENGIEEISEVELAFHIFDGESWDAIVDTEKYSLEF